MTPAEYASARIHAIFRKVQETSGGNLLAEHQTKEELGLTDFWRLPEQDEELKFYHYLSADSVFTDAIVELFGISYRCWHGCGYLGWPGFPACRFFLLHNQMTSGVKVSILSGGDRYMYEPKQ